MGVFVILLRAIGPVTHKIMSMTAWRDAVAQAGYGDPQTYVATGNMVVESRKCLTTVVREMNAIVQELGLGPGNTAVVRRAEDLVALAAANPFLEATAERPSEVAVYFFAGQPDLSWLHDYDGPEPFRVINEHLFVDYQGRGAQGPRLAGLVEKRSGTATARNWNTVRALAERADARIRR
jgi:uncharacterized protein (DUF1697 family)